MITSNLLAESFCFFCLRNCRIRTVIRICCSRIGVVNQLMGAVVCLDVSQQGTPRDTPAMQMSLYGDSFRGHDSSCVDLFCLATENQGQHQNVERQHAAACDAGLRIDHFELIKQKFRSCSSEHHPLTGSLQCRKAACSHNPLCLDMSCSDPSMLRAVKLRHLKPLPPYVVQSNQSK